MINKIYLIRDNRDAAIAALNNYLDRIYKLTEDYFEDGKLKEGLTPDEKIEKFVLELYHDAEKYENVRRKLINNDFNLSLIEINHVALAFVYMVERWKNEVKLLSNTITQANDIIKVLMSTPDSDINENVEKIETEIVSEE